MYFIFFSFVAIVCMFDIVYFATVSHRKVKIIWVMG